MRNYKEYRKIWEQHFGLIPKGMEIHHKDSDHSNNKIENLMLVTPEEHFYLHLDRGEYAAAAMIGARMKILPDEHSEAARKSALERVKLGTHNFQIKGRITAKDKEGNITVTNKDDPKWLSGELVGVNKGDTNNPNRKGLNVGKVGVIDEFGKTFQTTKNDPRIGDTLRTIRSTLPSNSKGKTWKNNLKKESCNYCGLVARKQAITRWHNEKCKEKYEG